MHILWLKMRPDTPQIYEYILLEHAEGKADDFMNANPWTQFFDLMGRAEIPRSIAKHFVIRDCKCECDTFFNVTKNEEQYHLSDFVFENLEIRAKNNGFSEDMIENISVKKVQVIQ